MTPQDQPKFHELDEADQGKLIAKATEATNKEQHDLLHPNPLKEILIDLVDDLDGKHFLDVDATEAAIKAYFLDLIGDDEPAIKYGNRRPSTVDEWENDMALARNAVRRELREKLK